METPKSLSPEEVDELLARVLLVFAKRGRELRRLREAAKSQEPTLPNEADNEATATSQNEPQQ